MTQRRLVAILSLDVVGYSQMMQRGSASLLKTLNTLYPLALLGNGLAVGSISRLHGLGICREAACRLCS